MISIIIPVYNEEKRIKFLLDNLERMKDEGTPSEVIFVDGGSQDKTVNFLKQTEHRVVLSEKGRGRQLHTGALKSSGDILFFLHADTCFKESPLKEIQTACQNYDAGAFSVQFPNKHPLMKLIAWGSNLRLKYRKIAFGDQGIFVTREAYQKVDGFKPIPLMEDYDFSMRLKESGAKLYRSRKPVYASARKFEKDGILRTLYTMQKCQSLFRRGAAIEEIEKIYYR